ncbi:uncharacterized protein [Diadema setosum]|uniref:uncharacterized protein n=1 Tax=Diadema setosum TaxID=31175 RepID=UPI003B3A9E42
MGESETAIVHPLPSVPFNEHYQPPPMGNGYLYHFSDFGPMPPTYFDVTNSSNDKHASSPSHSASPPSSYQQLSSPEFPELRTVANQWESSPSPSRPGAFQQQKTCPLEPWGSATSTPDLCRSLSLSMPSTGLSLYGSCDRFSSYLNMSSDSLGSIKLGSCGEIPSDFDSVRSSTGTLDRGYGSMGLNSLVCEQRTIGSLKELSYSEVASTLYSLEQTSVPVHRHHTSSAPSLVAAVAPTKSNHALQPNRMRELLPMPGANETCGKAQITSDLHHDSAHRLFYGYDSVPGRSQFHVLGAGYTGGAIPGARHSSSLERLVPTGSSSLTQCVPDAYEQTHLTGSAPASSTTSLPEMTRRASSTDNDGGRVPLPPLSRGVGYQGSDIANKPSQRIDAKGAMHHCNFCEKTFSRPTSLKTHIKTHIGKKSYLCDLCGKTFFQAANLTTHVRVHSGEKPFSCKLCGKHFSQSSSLKTHMRTHSGERPYKCPTCSISFSDNSTLTKHRRIHTGQKPYRCSVCQQSFSQSGNLSRHMKIHTRN